MLTQTIDQDYLSEQAYQDQCADQAFLDDRGSGCFDIRRIPFVTKVSSPSRKRRKNPYPSTSARSSRATGSSRTRKRQPADMGSSLGKIDSLKDAQAWGRIAARLNWGLSELDAEVDAVVQEAAIASYENRMLQLHGAPF